MSKGKPLNREQIDAIKQTVIGQYRDQTELRTMQDDESDNQSDLAQASKAVGYKSPPHSTRFKPGHSGNPKRPTAQECQHKNVA